MNKKYFQLVYTSKTNEYSINAISSNSRIDKSKITDEVKQYSQIIWVCTNKESLINKANELKKEKIAKCQENLKTANDISILVG